MIDTNTVTTLTQLGNSASATIHLHWPAILAIIGWITHANWNTIQAYCDTRSGGMIPWIFHFLAGKPQLPKP
jgi:hypothetical protein